MKRGVKGLLALAAACPASALAHGGAAPADSGLWRQWDLSPEVSLPLSAATALYVAGVLRLWRRAGAGRGISRWRTAAFGSGVLVLAIALVSPLDTAAAERFSLHMVQHLLLIVVAPPLLVAGAAETAFLWGLPPRWRRGYGRFTRAAAGWLTSTDRAAGNRALVVALATGVLWVWHVPALYDLAVRNEPVHFAEHLSFLVTAVLFWMTVLRLRPGPRAANGARILSVFAMALQGAMLGALITFAAEPLYASYRSGSGVADLDPLADQQLAGLIMWIPPGLLYAGVAARLFVSWLEAVGTRNRRHAAPTAAPRAALPGGRGASEPPAAGRQPHALGGLSAARAGADSTRAAAVDARQPVEIRPAIASGGFPPDPATPADAG